MVNISWSNYLTVAGAVSGLYYTALWLKYRKSGQAAQRTGSATNGKSAPDNQPVLFQDTVKRQSQEPSAADTTVQALVEELQAFISQGAAEKMDKPTLLTGLRKLLAKYPAIYDTEFKHSLNLLLITSIETNCAIHLNAEEVAGLWIK